MLFAFSSSSEKFNCDWLVVFESVSVLSLPCSLSSSSMIVECFFCLHHLYRCSCLGCLLSYYSVDWGHVCCQCCQRFPSLWPCLQSPVFAEYSYSHYIWLVGHKCPFLFSGSKISQPNFLWTQFLKINIFNPFLAFKT